MLSTCWCVCICRSGDHPDFISSLTDSLLSIAHPSSSSSSSPYAWLSAREASQSSSANAIRVAVWQALCLLAPRIPPHKLPQVRHCYCINCAHMLFGSSDIQQQHLSMVDASSDCSCFVRWVQGSDSCSPFKIVTAAQAQTLSFSYSARADLQLPCPTSHGVTGFSLLTLIAIIVNMCSALTASYAHVLHLGRWCSWAGPACW